jgi:hypothetical protein
MRSTLLGAMAAAALVCGTGAAQAQSPSDMMGKHSMEGEVTKVDAKKGWVHVKTSEGTMIVHFPPAALQDVHKGDTMTVHLALKDMGQPAKK